MKKYFSKRLRLIAFLYAFYFTFSTSSNAGLVTSACKALFPKNKNYEKKCIKHSGFFDTKSDFIESCRDRFKQEEERMACLRSGAEITIFHICNTLSWSNENTLSCLRYYPTESLKKECLLFSDKEEIQLRCLKEGREPDRVKVCRIKFEKEEDRIDCLTKDLFPNE